ncbi:MAG: hypothetical protein ACYDBH_20425 [Acidobacteriaceae bacterium]
MNRAISKLVIVTMALTAIPTGTVLARGAPPGSVYRLLAPPRESAAVGKADYGPVAAFLTKVTGQQFVYVRPHGWLQCQMWIWKNYGDVYFDGPHFVSWRLHNQGATLGPRISKEHAPAGSYI